MLIELPAPWLITVNVLAWLALHLGLAWLGTRLPTRLFSPRLWPYRPRAWEGAGRIYQRLFLVRKWKDRLPDGAVLFARGFPKANLQTATAEYVKRFIRETCRGETVHWATLTAAALFFIWNPVWAGLVMVAYAVAANGPCILAQRYNRLRLCRLLAAIEARQVNQPLSRIPR